MITHGFIVRWLPVIVISVTPMKCHLHEDGDHACLIHNCSLNRVQSLFGEWIVIIIANISRMHTICHHCCKLFRYQTHLIPRGLQERGYCHDLQFRQWTWSHWEVNWLARGVTPLVRGGPGLELGADRMETLGAAASLHQGGGLKTGNQSCDSRRNMFK